MGAVARVLLLLGNYTPGKVSGFAESKSKVITPTCQFELWPLSPHFSSSTWHMLQADILHDIVTQQKCKRENCTLPMLVHMHTCSTISTGNGNQHGCSHVRNAQLTHFFQKLYCIKK